MFRNTYQRGFLTVFSSSGSKPLEIWDVFTKNGHSKRVTDEELKLMSFELMGVNVATTYMVAPKCPCPSLGVKLPFLVLLVKNLKKFFSFEIQILDDRNTLRRFRASNYQSATRVDNFCTVMPLALTPGWNQIQFNLADFTRRAYGTNYIETVRIQIHANVRVKRVYFCDRLYPDDELPAHLRLHPPLRPCKISELTRRRGKNPAEAVETIRPTTPVMETGDRAPVNVEPGESNSRRGSINPPIEPIVEIIEEIVGAENGTALHDATEIPIVTSAPEIAVQY
ncbi:uncharacterized protein LOC135711112 [Ochlerotatus camptorhynchus]|uniref:uncharacterized protein LOC135711112 n=1 Tax=Ochlerotatus camptorhynchus TaxID=644619 RepID=UPI0031D1B692